MKDELRRESQAEICRGGKITKSPFFCPTYLSAILPLGAGSPRRSRLVLRSRCGEGGCGEGGSSSVKPGQTDLVGQAASQKQTQIPENEWLAE
jgi:hypothetical protein